MKDKNVFSMIPKVDEMLNNDKINEKLDKLPRKIVVDSIREEIEILRTEIREYNYSADIVKKRVEELSDLILRRIDRKRDMNLRRVINCTGVVLHTNLGRSLIGERVMKNICEVSQNYSNLEFDLEKGVRGSRYDHVEQLLKEITGAESAMVVNNNAAAVMLVLNTLAKGKEVIVSRGELVEIGGSFRVPEVMEQSGAYLVDVGTTNKTHISDYENKVDEDTAALMKVHTSNYRILGFTSSVTLEDLNQLKRKYDLPLIEDLGSGVLIDLSKYGLEYEPTVQDSIKKGVDVITFSGDKLLGGPQAGIIVGKKEYIEEMKKNQLTRALRIDKFTISALEATLKLYLDEKMAIENIPTLKMLTTDIQILDERANQLKNMIQNNIDIDSLMVEIVDDFSQVGGGSLPLERIPTKCLTMWSTELNVNYLEKKLRDFEVPIITRINNDKIYIDLRTVKDEELDIILKGIEFALK
jgi:L-seryl-tRNA(Ser) seleniumtransferase